MNSIFLTLKPKLKAIILFAGLATLLAFGFQNCSGNHTSRGPQSSVESASTAPDSSSSSNYTNPNQTNNSSSSSSSTGSNSSGFGTINSSQVVPDLLTNFISDDKQTCDNSIKARTTKPYTCVMGGGCGISCGVPGGSCTSANPTKYGACVMAPPPSFSGCLPAGTSFPIACDAVTGSTTLKWNGCCSGNYVKTCGALGTTAANKVVCQ